MKRAIFLLLLVFSMAPIAPSAHAQQALKLTTCGTASPPSGMGPVYIDASGNLCVNAVVSATVVPLVGTPTEATVSCGTGSTTFLAAAAASQFILIKVPASATVPVWFNFAGAAAVAAPPSVDLAAGASSSWTSFVPTAQINCLATSATSVTVVYK